MNRDIKIIAAKEIDWIEFFNKTNIYNIKTDLDIKTWDDFILKNFQKLNFFDPGFLEGKDITSLNGCPKEFSGDFNCRYNKLTSLEGAPEEVDGTFLCNINKLTSLKGGPQKVGGHFDCSCNKLTSLKGAPSEIRGSFWCECNKLTSLEGAPQKVAGYFDCSNNDSLPRYKVYAYEAYLKLSDSEKAPLTKDGHYCPTDNWENKFK